MIWTASPGACLARLRQARQASSRMRISSGLPGVFTTVMHSFPQFLTRRERYVNAGVFGLQRSWSTMRHRFPGPSSSALRASPREAILFLRGVQSLGQVQVPHLFQNADCSEDNQHVRR